MKLFMKKRMERNCSQKISLNSEIKNKFLFEISKKWLNESTSPEEILGKSREWFLKGCFTYSINPGNMSKKSPYY